jgi:hypothetical protein
MRFKEIIGVYMETCSLGVSCRKPSIRKQNRLKVVECGGGSLDSITRRSGTITSNPYTLSSAKYRPPSESIVTRLKVDRALRNWAVVTLTATRYPQKSSHMSTRYAIKGENPVWGFQGQTVDPKSERECYKETQFWLMNLSVSFTQTQNWWYRPKIQDLVPFTVANVKLFDSKGCRFGNKCRYLTVLNNNIWLNKRGTCFRFFSGQRF